jgi:subtilisin-like proprotein convertase family protein
MRALSFGLFLAMALVACGPGSRGNGADDDDGGDDAPGIDAPTGGDCVPRAEMCGDGIDNDCDLRTDCGDPDCSGVGSCPVCGAVENPESQPLALPDGTSQSTPCTTNAQCSGGAPNCVQDECHASYTSSLNFIGFPMYSLLADENKLLSVCVKMEHSWLRDLQIDLIPPDGRVIELHAFVDRIGGEIFLGEANDADSAGSPVPGVGYQYCWKPGGQRIMLDTPTVDMGGNATLPAGDFKSVTPWAGMVGSPLNGNWTIRVTDLWSIDNGFMFEWSIAFDPTLVVDCSGPIIL